MKKDYAEWEKADLIKEIMQLKKRKKFGLVWEDKPEEVAEICKEQLPILIEKKSKDISTNTAEPTNIIIEGDNYHALSVLNYTHKAKVDLIYIDPPYNTGAKDWKYNNHFVDSNDSYRHSKWISMMAKRLVLAKNLLTQDGIIVVTIDDYEVFHTGLLLDEIYGEKNKIGVIVVENNPRGRTTNAFYATSHEYYLVYAKDITKAKIIPLQLTVEQEKLFKHQDEVSAYRLLPFRRSGGLSTPEERPNSCYPIYYNEKDGRIDIESFSGSKEIMPVDSKGKMRVWRQTRPSLMNAVERGDVIIDKVKGNYRVLLKDRIKSGRKAKTIWVNPKYDASSNGTVLLEKILGASKAFAYPKSIWAVRDFLFTVIGEKKSATVVDFFAGSGTTGHAVLGLNKEDGGKRQFILCTNNENGIAEEVTYPRVKNVMLGYKSGSSESEGLGGNLKYYKTSFVNRVVTDADRRDFVSHATEMLCLAEATYREKKFVKGKFSIYSNESKTTAIIYDEDYIAEAKAELGNFKGKLTIYVFSYDNTYDGDDFNDLNGDFSVRPIPAVILNVYNRIMRQGAKRINI